MPLSPWRGEHRWHLISLYAALFSLISVKAVTVQALPGVLTAASAGKPAARGNAAAQDWTDAGWVAWTAGGWRRGAAAVSLSSSVLSVAQSVRHFCVDHRLGL